MTCMTCMISMGALANIWLHSGQVSHLQVHDRAHALTAVPAWPGGVHMHVTEACAWAASCSLIHHHLLFSLCALAHPQAPSAATSSSPSQWQGSPSRDPATPGSPTSRAPLAAPQAPGRSLQGSEFWTSVSMPRVQEGQRWVEWVKGGWDKGQRSGEGRVSRVRYVCMTKSTCAGGRG
jgi:hypothetical protein